MANPWQLASLFAEMQNGAAQQMRGQAQQSLLNVFQEEASRQRPYVTMPAELALRQQDRINAEPFAERAAIRSRRYRKGGTQDQEEGITDTSGGVVATDEADGKYTDDDGNTYYVVDGKRYNI